MTTYLYSCPACSRFEASFAMGTAPRTVACPRCGTSAERRFSSPQIGLADRGRMSLIDRTRASAESPDVVSAVPGTPRRRTPVTTDPRHQRLPRP